VPKEYQALALNNLRANSTLRTKPTLMRKSITKK